MTAKGELTNVREMGFIRAVRHRRIVRPCGAILLGYPTSDFVVLGKVDATASGFVNMSRGGKASRDKKNGTNHTISMTNKRRPANEIFAGKLA